MKDKLIPVKGSRSVHAGKFIGYPKPSSSLTFNVFLKRPFLSEEQYKEVCEIITQHPSERQYLTLEELPKYTAAREEDIEKVTDYFKENGMNILHFSAEERWLEFESTVSVFEKTFKTNLGVYQGINQQNHLGYRGALNAPKKVAKCIDRILGLNKEVKIEHRNPTKPQTGDAEDGWDKGFSLAQLASAYNFPKDCTGKGQCIGIVELGGTYGRADYKNYFEFIDQKAPKVSIVGDKPSQSEEMANAEVTLDLQVAGALAPEAKLVIYYAHSLMDALQMIVSDKKNNPSVVSISWAATEGYYHPSQRKIYDNLLFEAALLGITIIAASGDYGAYNRMPNPEVSMPAAHPYVLGVGGTMVKLKDDKIIDEVVWNEYRGSQSTGGGYSGLYTLPQYQYATLAPLYGGRHGRGVPDVAAHASTIMGYQVFFEGKKTAIGGTSAAAPLWAALIALLNEKLGYRLGFVNNVLYALSGSIGFNPVLKGQNQMYHAGPVWNPCTGLGTPNGQHLYELIQAQAEQIKDNQSTD